MKTARKLKSGKKPQSRLWRDLYSLGHSTPQCTGKTGPSLPGMPMWTPSRPARPCLEISSSAPTNNLERSLLWPFMALYSKSKCCVEKWHESNFSSCHLVSGHRVSTDKMRKFMHNIPVLMSGLNKSVDTIRNMSVGPTSEKNLLKFAQQERNNDKGDSKCFCHISRTSSTFAIAQ